MPQEPRIVLLTLAKNEGKSLTVKQVEKAGAESPYD